MEKYKIINIDCPNCAAKIETNLNKLKEVKYASIDFSNQTLFLDTSNIEKVKKTIQETEPGVEIQKENENFVQVNFDEEERSKIKKELILISAVAVIFVLGIIFQNQIESSLNPFLKYLVFIPLYLIAGKTVLTGAFKKIIKGNFFDEHFLMTVATLGAIAIGEIAEAVGVMIFYQIGEFLQQLSVKKARRSIKTLLEIKPDFANLILKNETIKVDPKEVKISDEILVKPGEKIPLDGIILEGNSFIDNSALTGESVPKSVSKNDEVLAGSINLNGLLKIKVTKLFENSSVARILELTENATAKKAETEKFITKFSRYYTPVVVFSAILIATIPPLFLNQNFDDWLYRALVILVISCPCALVISIPLGYFGGIGGASKKGILIKGSNFLDALTKVKTVVFDKTGTLTKGVFKVTEVIPANGFSKNQILKIAAEAESKSNHPVAKSISEEYKNIFGNEIPESATEFYNEIPGHGIKARINGNEIILGNDKLLHLVNIEHENCNFDGTVIHLAVNQKFAGTIKISDEIKEESVHAIQYLKNLNVEKIIMLTGDNFESAKEISEKLNLDEFYSELLPEQKVEILEKLISEKKEKDEKIAFAGDGINDAPVIARADIGFAMGALGNDTAIETADVVLMTGNPAKIGTAIQIAHKTRKIVWQNIFFALGVKLFFIALGAIGIASMWEAVFADMGVALLAILNSLRVMR